MIVERLDEWYRAHGEESRKLEPFRFRPSNLGDCLRKSAHLLLGMEPKALEPENVRTFEKGTQRGERLEEVSRLIWHDSRTQVPVSMRFGPGEKWKIEGTLDLWIPDLDGRPAVVDFKTQATFGFGLLDQEGVIETYALQIHAYRRMAGVLAFCRNVPRESVRAFVVYEAKDSDARKGIKDAKLKELEVPWTDELDAKFLSRLAEVAEIMESHQQIRLDPKKVPEGYVKGAWQCRHCSIGEERGGCFK